MRKTELMIKNFHPETAEEETHGTFTLDPENFTVGGFSPWRLSDDRNTSEPVKKMEAEVGGDSFFWIDASEAEDGGSFISRKRHDTHSSYEIHQIC